MKFNRLFTVFLSLAFCWLLLSAFSGLQPPPSYHQGYARSAGESTYPALWRGIEALYAPTLGISGDTLFNWGGRGRNATLIHGDTVNILWQFTHDASGATHNERLPGYALNIEAVSAGSGGDHAYVDCTVWSIAGSAMSFFAWFQSESFITADARIMNKSSGTSESEHAWMLSMVSSSGQKLRVRLNTGGSTTTTVATSGTMSLNVWYFGGYTYDGATTRIYLDGVEVGSGSQSGAIEESSDTVLLGNGTQTGVDGFNSSWDGVISNAVFYNRALSPTEIIFLYNNADALVRLRSPLVAKAPAVAPASVPKRTLMGVGTRIIEGLEWKRRAYPCDEIYCY